MSIVADVRDAAPPSHVAEFVAVVLGAALVVVTYWANRRYRQWSDDSSLLAAPRARAAALKTSYRRKRTDVAHATEIIGDLLDVIQRPR